MTQSAGPHTVRMYLPLAEASEAPRTSSRLARLDSLTGLRFFAAGIVFFHHGFELTTGTLREAMQAVFGHGRAGVSFFFVLSGFVLAWSMKPGDTAVSFWRRRAAKLWPAYAVATVAAYGVSRFFDGRYFSLKRLAANLAMVQAWIPAKDWYFSVNAVNWSLSVEAFFYLTFPLYAATLLRLRGRQAAALAAVLFGGVLAVAAVFGRDIILGNGWTLPDTMGVWIVYVSPVVRIMEFLLGILMVTMIRRGVMPRVPVGVAWGSLAAGWVLAGQVPAGFSVVAVTVVPFCLLILAYAQTDIAAPRTTVWSSRTMVTLGNISFCFYLVHQLVMRLFTSEVGLHWLGMSTGVRSLKVLGLIFTVSLFCAWSLHTFVEKPCERLLKGRAGRPVPAGREKVAQEAIDREDVVREGVAAAPTHRRAAPQPREARLSRPARHAAPSPAPRATPGASPRARRLVEAGMDPLITAPRPRGW